MSWHFSQALVAEYLADTFSAGEPSAPLNKISMPPLFSQCVKMMEACRRFLSGMTSKPLTEQDGEALLTWFQAGSHVKTYQSTEAGQELKESGLAFGRKWRESFAKWDRNLSLWKTRQLSLIEGSVSFSATWPKWGSMRSGAVCRQRTLVHHTKESESGLWATPTASDWKGACAGSKFGQRKSQFEKLADGLFSDGSIYPNPTAFEVLMGWPVGWTDLKPLEMGKFHEWQQQHGDFCQEGSEGD